jgi:hypothetical protein
MKLTRPLLVALVLALAAASLGGCLVRGHAGVAYVVEADAPPPPPPRRVYVETRPGFFWIEGNWHWHGGRWVWRDGYYERHRSGHVYVQGRWDHRGGRRHWVPGRWKPHRGGGHGNARGVTVRDHRTGRPYEKVKARPGKHRDRDRD